MDQHIDIIFLNGTSSAGKSTLARALQHRLPGTWLHVTLDMVFNLLPRSFVDDPAWVDRINWDEFLPGFHAAVAQLPKTGFPVILDHVCTSRRWRDDCVLRFQHYQVLYVGVTCPLEELCRREQLRGDRKIGIAEEHLATYHGAGPYDLEVDTHASTTDICVERIIAAMEHPTAFRRMYAELQRVNR